MNAAAVFRRLVREFLETPGVIGAMARTFRNLLEIKDMGRGPNAWQVAGQLRMPKDAAESVLKVLSSFSPNVQGKTIDLSKTYTTEFVIKANATH